jgi:hypothetical protein
VPILFHAFATGGEMISHLLRTMRRSAERAEGSPAEYVQVKMSHRLTPVVSDIRGDSVPRFSKTLVDSDLAGGIDECHDDPAIAWQQVVQRRNVFPRNDNDVGRCSGLDVAERDNVVVLIHGLTGDITYHYAAEYT